MTDQPKWTPGPWRYDRTNGSPTTGEHMIAGAKPGYLAEVRDCGSGDVRANAHLIAAAPDMAGVSPRAAEMLRVAATFLRSEEPNGTVFYDGAACDAFCIADDCEAAADDIDAALAKARGQA